ncbi:DNA-binding XRE family transcriptional regulator [Mobilisporobacter senegalensis]|uniref:DNA-binding XRE family transcriptional regulator n=1 Tax=Mobilisporobacter senegalensis TaxID=1329262 RepID=A0A3N1XGM1_9FIRM|nr:helix-turn-helix transcriptional regulator [Mobilisporobacter senegalensis]ROR23957.1 DNA-binding XRE family transcriptional regulator [Mobilisporobacter senegalensis]
MLNRKELGAAIKKARMENKITQEKLAEMLDISPVHIKQLEAGTRMPSVELLYNLAITLNISVDDVFFQRKPSDAELLGKIERILSICTQHDLRVVYATASALKDKDIQ